MKRKGASQQGASSQAAKSRKTADEDNEKQPLRTAESAADDDSDEKQPLCGCLCGKDLGVIGTDAASLEETAALRGGRDVWECDSCGTTSDRRYGCVQKNGGCDLDVCGKCRDAGHCSSIISTARTKIEDIKQKAKESARYNKDLVQATQRKNKELQSKLAEAEKELIALREEVSELKAVRKLDMDEPEPEWGTGNLEPKEEEEGGSENEDLALVVSTPKPEALAAPVNRPPPAEPVHNKPESPQSQAPSPTTWKIVAGVTLTDGLKSKAMCWGSESKTETVCGPVTDCKVKCNHCGKQLQPKVHNIKGHWKNHHSPEAEKGKAARPKTGATTPSAVSTNTSGTHKSPFEAESATELSIQDSITIDTALKCIPFSWYSDTLHRRNLSSELQGEGFGKEKVAARTDTLAEEVRTVVREKVVDRDCVVMIDVAKKNRRSWLGFALACDGATYFHDVVELLDTKSETIRTACEENFANLEDHGVRVFAVCADNANNMLRALKDMQGESMDVDDLDGDDDYEPNDEDEDSCDHIVDLTLDFCALA
ncbi:hypothetical protein DIPPA_17002 [Diplonema papillatum]|nr:hypothetical protein DIPPA_17002 [Diplonema papillatum]